MCLTSDIVTGPDLVQETVDGNEDLADAKVLKRCFRFFSCFTSVAGEF